MLVVLVSCVGCDDACRTVAPVGSEFQVNTYATGNQRQGTVAMAADGSFVVVFQSDGGDGDSGAILAQRFAADGTKTGSELVVNSYTTSSQGSPAVACEADGDFVVAWSSNGSAGTDTDSNSIQGQRFAADGTPIGSQFQINTHTTSSQSGPRIAMCGNDSFVVVWASDEQDGHSFGVFGQRFSAKGSPAGSEFQVNTYITNNQTQARVACDADGDFVVTWTCHNRDHDGVGGIDPRNTIYAQRFSSTGTKAGSELQISGSTTVHWQWPAVDMAPNGDFVVTWYGYDNPVWNYSTFVRRYAADGTPKAAELMVNDTNPTGSAEGHPSVAVDQHGDFIVVWAEWSGNTTARHDILARGFHADGSELFAEWMVNTHTIENQDEPEIALAGHGMGRFVVIWEADESAGPDLTDSTQGQLYSYTPASPTVVVAGN
jgi:hypothetical protein